MSLLTIGGLASLQGYVEALISAALLIGMYTAWTRYLLRGLRTSEEKLSLQDSVNSQVRAFGTLGLWLMEIAALAFIGFGILIVLTDPGNRPIALASIAFFGLSAAKFALLLVQQRRTAIRRS